MKPSTSWAKRRTLAQKCSGGVQKSRRRNQLKLEELQYKNVNEKLQAAIMKSKTGRQIQADEFATMRQTPHRLISSRLLQNIVNTFYPEDVNYTRLPATKKLVGRKTPGLEGMPEYCPESARYVCDDMCKCCGVVTLNVKTAFNAANWKQYMRVTSVWF